MNNKINYQKLCFETIEKIDLLPEKPKLLLHACCGPCSTSVTELLIKHFDITIFFSNSNITDKSEYQKRLEQIYLLKERAPFYKNVKIVEDKFVPDDYIKYVTGFENEPEGGSRCTKCFEYRLERTARYASENDFGWFCTTLTVSPHKNPELINSIGVELSKKYNTDFLVSDFKKNNGYLRSNELSRQFEIYRQNYCGCIFSERQK